jgi:hypothetical protein
VLVFDCVALQFREGISGLFSERKGMCFFLRAELSRRHQFSAVRSRLL